jgi:serine-type D-Ala-D-Ala carboxypeptidase (penicillin-binding protein 5/6)
MTRVLALLVVVLGLITASVGAQEVLPAYETKARNAILIDGKSGEVFFEKDADTAVPPASMSKMMIQSIVFDMLQAGDLKEDQEFITSVDAWKRGGGAAGGSTMWLEPNKPARVIDLLRGAIIQSANDACLALAEGIAGSESAFLERMRRKAEKLGLKNSNFRNVTGLPDPDHKMSVRDLAILARHIVYEHADRYSLYGERSFTWNKIAQENRNPLLKDFPGADGMKTGYTKESGYGMVGSVQRDGRRLIMVVAGLESIADRKSEAQKLLDWGFRQFKTIDVFEAGEVVSKARVWGGAEQFVDLQVDKAFQVALTPTEQKTVELKITYKGPMIAPVKAGEVVGQARVIVRGKVVSEIPVVTVKDVAAVESIWRKSLDSMLIMFLGG